MEMNLNNAAEIILAKAIDDIDQMIADDPGASDDDSRIFARSLVLIDLWERLTRFVGYTGDDLRDKACQFDEEEEEGDEEVVGEVRR